MVSSDPVRQGENPDPPGPSAPTSDSFLLTAALAYVAAGIPVFPCHARAKDGGCSCHRSDCKSPAKHPATRHGVKDATTNASVVRRWWGLDGEYEWNNIGIAMGEVSGRWVLDVDPRHGGDATLAALEAEHGALPATLRQETPSGGWHLFFRCPAGLGLKNIVNEADGLDVRCDGGYVVGAPSVGANRKPYQMDLARLDRESLADAPEWLIEWLRAHSKKPKTTPTTSSTQATEQAPEPSAPAPDPAQPPRSSSAPSSRPPAPESLAARISAACASSPAKVLAFFAENGIAGLAPQGDAGWYKGSAPWTDAGKDPSFGVHPATGSWKAWREGGTTGGLIEFLVREKHMGKHDADREVARSLGIEWREESPKREEARSAAEDALKLARAVLDEVESLEDVEAIYADGFAKRAAMLYVNDSASFAILCARLQKKFPKTYKRNAFMAVVRQHAREIPSTAIEPSKSDMDRGDPFGWFMASGVPPQSVVPRGWQLSKSGAICKYTERATQDGSVAPHLNEVCRDPVFVVGVGINLSTKDHTITLAWRKGKRWSRQEFDCGDISEGKGLKALRKMGFSISCMTWNLLAEWIVHFEQANHHLIPVKYVTSRFGPTKDEDGNLLGFMCGKTFIPHPKAPRDSEDRVQNVAFRAADAGNDQIAESIHTHGSMSAQIAALKRLSKFPKSIISVYASLAAPLLEILSAQNFGCDWWTDTSRGKTKTMIAAASAWANPDPRGGGFLGSWDGTRTSFERRTTLLNGMPVLADESQRARNVEEMGASVYDIINGLSRARGTIDGLAASLGGHVVLLSTGERPLTLVLKYGGLKARVISISGGPFGDPDPANGIMVDEVSDELLANYGHLAPAFIRWIYEHNDESGDWRMMWEDQRAAYRSMAKGNNVAGRLCDYLATLEVTAMLLHRAIKLPWSHEEIVESIWSDVMRGAAEADTAKAAFDDAVGWCRSNENAFIGRAPKDMSGEPVQPIGGWLGVASEDLTCEWEWGVIPHRLTDFLKDQGYDPSIPKTWGERGVLVVDVAGQKKRSDGTIMARDGKRQFRVYAFSRKEIAKLDKPE